MLMMLTFLLYTIGTAFFCMLYTNLKWWENYYKNDIAARKIIITAKINKLHR